MRALVGGLLCLLAASLAACGSEITIGEPEPLAAGGAGGGLSAAPTTSTATSSVGTGGAGASGNGGGVAVGGMGGGTGGQGGMPPPGCSGSLQMVNPGVQINPQHVSLSVTASQFIGGIDRWVFDFVWSYDDPMYDDEEAWAEVTVRLMRVDPNQEPGPTLKTWLYPQDSGNPLEYHEGAFTYPWFGQERLDIVPTSGHFAIQRINDVFSGTVCFDGQHVQGMMHPASPVLLSGPFSVAVP